MRAFTYLLYLIFWFSVTLGVTGYLVIVEDRSGWWLVLGILLSMAGYSPEKWSILFTKDAEEIKELRKMIKESDE